MIRHLWKSSYTLNTTIGRFVCDFAVFTIRKDKNRAMGQDTCQLGRCMHARPLRELEKKNKEKEGTVTLIDWKIKQIDRE